MMQVRVRVDSTKLKRHIAALAEAGRYRGYAGVFADGKGGTRYPNGLTVLDVLAIHEFGAPTVGIPKRSVVEYVGRDTARQANETLRRAVKDMVRKHDGSIVRQALERVCREAAERMEDRVRDPMTPPPPNAPATVRKKGFNNPLFHTGVLAESFEWRVVDAEQSRE